MFAGGVSWEAWFSDSGMADVPHDGSDDQMSSLYTEVCMEIGGVKRERVMGGSEEEGEKNREGVKESQRGIRFCGVKYSIDRESYRDGDIG